MTFLFDEALSSLAIGDTHPNSDQCRGRLENRRRADSGLPLNNQCDIRGASEWEEQVQGVLYPRLHRNDHLKNLTIKVV